MKFAWITLVLVAGCAQEPFVRAPLPELNGPDPRSMRAAFALSLPMHFISDDTVIIDAPFNHDFAFLGVLEVNRPTGDFEFVALNQMGLKLFQLGGNSRGVQVQYALGPLKDHQDILTAIGEDFRRMYFDLVPSEASDIDIGRRTVKFSEKTSGGSVEYQFGGDPAVLLEKGEGGFLFGWQWRVQYFQYGLQNGTLYPRGIVMDNSNFHYRIIVKNRDRELR
jgi:hypothetical protein